MLTLGQCPEIICNSLPVWQTEENTSSPDLLGTDSAAESFPTSPVGLAYLKLSFPPQNLSLLKCFDSSNTSISHLGMKTCVVDGLSVLLPTTTIPSVSNSVRA